MRQLLFCAWGAWKCPIRHAQDKQAGGKKELGARLFLPRLEAIKSTWQVSGFRELSSGCTEQGQSAVQL